MSFPLSGFCLVGWVLRWFIFFQWESHLTLAFIKWSPFFFCTSVFPLLVCNVRFISPPIIMAGIWGMSITLPWSQHLNLISVWGSKARGLDGKLPKLAEKILLGCFHNKLSQLATNPKNDFVLQWKVICLSCLALYTSTEQTCCHGLLPISLQLCPSHRISSALAK